MQDIIVAILAIFILIGCFILVARSGMVGSPYLDNSELFDDDDDDDE